MDINQRFYNNIATEYDKLFDNWEVTAKEQGEFLDSLFISQGFSKEVRILDCASGIGTQTIGLAQLGYDMCASDISTEEIKEAKRRAKDKKLNINFKQADFRYLSNAFSECFEIILAMDNALPHMLTEEDLRNAVKSIIDQLSPNGIFIASIRDYDQILKEKPTYSSPYIYKTDSGQRIAFQTWEWEEENYKFTQYIIEDEDDLSVSTFDGEYRAVKREELTNLLLSSGCREVTWLMPEDSGFYQPIVIARK